MENKIRIKKQPLSPRIISKPRGAPLLNLPSILTEVTDCNPSLNNKKLKKVSSLFSYIEPSSISERGKTINMSNIGIKDNTFIPYKEQNQNELLNIKMSKLIQFKSMSKELNGKKVVVTKRKRPKFSSEIFTDGTKLNSINTTNTKNRSRNITNFTSSNQYSTNINTNTFRTVKPKKEIIVPKLKFSSFDKANTNNTARNMSTNANSNSCKKQSFVKIKKDNTSSKRGQSNTENSTNDIVSPKMKTVIKPILLLQKTNEEENEELEQFTPSSISTIDYNRSRIKNKVMSSFNTYIESLLPEMKNEIINPYRKSSIDLSLIRSSIINFDDERQIEYKAIPKEQKENLRYYLYHSSFGEIRYLLDKYYDCYNELADEVANEINVKGTSSNNLFTNFQRKLKKTNDVNDELYNEDDFDGNDLLYISKFILYDDNKNKEVLIAKSPKINHFKSLLKSAFKKKKHSSLFFAYESSNNLVNRITHQRTKSSSGIVSFNRAANKIASFSVLKQKEGFNRLNHDKYTKFLYEYNNMKKGNDGSLLGKALLDVSKRMNYYKKNNKSISNIHHELYRILCELDSNEFIKFYNNNKTDIDINARFINGNTMLITATKLGVIDIVKFLIESGADVNIQNFYLNTALHYANAHKFYDIINLLVNNGANEKLKNKYGETAWECFNAEREE